MEGENFHGTSHRGTNKFPQEDVKTADATGFGAAADDFMERGIDLNEQLIRNKPATFFMRVRGDAMTGAGIYDGDTIIVDRSIKAESGKVVVAILNGEMFIRRLEKTFNKVRLLPESKKHATIEVDASCDSLGIWGVVTYNIHQV
ncbi:peptidase S24 [Niastella yeongjuensis]|uniref:Peptidase S24 n=1 Tax=Niastella yeongjuensis TaxID=354355 RepID=A0A1V9EXE5_9BACT|nr:translesion error-prone DNA polymerase V autoproteolytic subunit [Niastella yeongjuensis]OQP50786.1 peptidase S24 [Niastella yeongjuensis]SEN17933.1 DNA polymerase V [Niastella yeongjuensis]